jgi:hypothetical protein
LLRIFVFNFQVSEKARGNAGTGSHGLTVQECSLSQIKYGVAVAVAGKISFLVAYCLPIVAEKQAIALKTPVSGSMSVIGIYRQLV